MSRLFCACLFSNKPPQFTPEPTKPSSATSRANQCLFARTAVQVLYSG